MKRLAFKTIVIFMVFSPCIEAASKDQVVNKLQTMSAFYIKILATENIDYRCKFLNENDHNILKVMKTTIDKEITNYGWPSLEKPEYKPGSIGYVEIDNEAHRLAKDVSTKHLCDKNSEKYTNEISTMSAKLLKMWGVPIY